LVNSYVFVASTLLITFAALMCERETVCVRYLMRNGPVNRGVQADCNSVNGLY